MSKVDLKKYDKGTILMQVQSLMPEKFVNLLWKYDVNIKNIKRINVTTIVLKINLKDYDKTKIASKKTNSKIKIIERKGISFILLRRNRVIALSIGIIIFICIMSYLSTYVWKICITTEKYLAPYEIRQQIAKYGIEEGTKKSKIDVHELEEKILKDNENVSWVKARIEGTNLNIQVYENINPPNMVREDEPCDIVASKDGEIVSVYTTSGTPVVKSGDIVKKGDILVKGEQGKEGETYAVHAKGCVIAKTFYERSKQIPIIEYKKVRTGNKIENVYINLGNKRIYLKKSLNKFNNYDKIIINKTIFVREIYYELKTVEIKNSYEERVNDTVQQLYEDIEKNLDKSVKITDKIIDKKKINNNIQVRLLVIGEEDIGESVPYNIRR